MVVLSVDHFIPKSVNPYLAYEWSNFRLAAARFNARKQDAIVCDPFTLEHQNFLINFDTLEVYPNPQLLIEAKLLLESTITCLDLNGELSVRGRNHWLEPYISGQITFDHLEKKAPFIAQELKRQGLVDTIRNIANT